MLWCLTGAVLVTGALFAIDRTEQRLITSDAERTAMHYADLVARTVPDLDRLFTERELTIEAHAALLRSYELGDVFRLKLFDRSGQQLLVSDDLGSTTPVSRVGVEELGSHHDDYRVSTVVLGGGNFVTLSDGSQDSDRPDWYSEAYVPLHDADGLLGVLEVYVDQSARHRRIASSFTEVATIVVAVLTSGALAIAWQMGRHLMERRRGEARIHYLAKHDTLSGALNRNSFETALTEATEMAGRTGMPFAVHCIDLDRFKQVNDRLGHAAGDRVLREVAARLYEVCSSDDVLARLGGDEFALLQAWVDSPQDVEAFGRRIVDALAPPIPVGTQQVWCGASVGAARFGLDASEIDELLHKADLAMYRSKAMGRGRFSFYDRALDREREDRRLLAADLRDALADDALSLHYQPLFDASDETLPPASYEALMRWQHPRRGNITPEIFIPLAEENGLIEALGTWAIDQACRAATRWNNRARVAVNLSAAQFTDHASDIVEVVSRALERSGLAPGRLEVEITESLLISDPGPVIRKLERLSALGVQIAMDDFGTGYSSLSYLWQFPFDKVKIDSAFVQGLESGDESDAKVALIIGSIVSLAHSLGMRVNAEGVETERQRKALQRLGCDELQGFLLGRPQPGLDGSPREGGEMSRLTARGVA